MHEMSLATEILSWVQKSAAQAGCRKVQKINLKVGAFAGVMLESLQFALEMLSKGTISEGAKIEIEKIPLKIHCEPCHKDFEIAPHAFLCPDCGRADIKIISGEELELTSIEGEEK